MTREKIEQKLTEYRKQRDQTQANLYAIGGAIQAMEQLLSDIDDNDRKEKVDNVSSD